MIQNDKEMQILRIFKKKSRKINKDKKEETKYMLQNV